MCATQDTILGGRRIGISLLLWLIAVPSCRTADQADDESFTWRYYERVGAALGIMPLDDKARKEGLFRAVRFYDGESLIEFSVAGERFGSILFMEVERDILGLEDILNQEDTDLRQFCKRSLSLQVDSEDLLQGVDRLVNRAANIQENEHWKGLRDVNWIVLEAWSPPTLLNGEANRKHYKRTLVPLIGERDPDLDYLLSLSFFLGFAFRDLISFDESAQILYYLRPHVSGMKEQISRYWERNSGATNMTLEGKREIYLRVLSGLL